ncbi:hypothetical protein NUSPORA_01477 [Nucleospora cyclopteri]
MGDFYLLKLFPSHVFLLLENNLIPELKLEKISIWGFELTFIFFNSHYFNFLQLMLFGLQTIKI